jgi:hypothetical protein
VPFCRKSPLYLFWTPFNLFSKQDVYNFFKRKTICVYNFVNDALFRWNVLSRKFWTTLLLIFQIEIVDIPHLPVVYPRGTFLIFGIISYDAQLYKFLDTPVSNLRDGKIESSQGVSFRE